MARHRRKPLPTEPVVVDILNLSHDGRGVARYPDGKTLFVDGALPSETVTVQRTSVRGRFDEGRVIDVAVSSPDRTPARCAQSLICGGCSLQHLGAEAQIRLKENTLREQLAHFAGTEPVQWLPPMTDAIWAYRRKARMGVKFVAKKNAVLVGFREKREHLLADIEQCHVLAPPFTHLVEELRNLFITLAARDRIPQVECAAGDAGAALVIRHLDPLSGTDHEAIVDFCRTHGYACYLQPGGPATVHRVWPQDGEERLTYRHPAFDVELAFHPQDFTQVNAGINRRMVELAIDMLDLDTQDRALDLFCGIGNFALPMARRAGSVVAVEAEQLMVERGNENAARNGIRNVQFLAADLQTNFLAQPWARGGFDKVLLDPPRSGAEDVCRFLANSQARRIVYVSCNPATLARDTAILCAGGYTLQQAGVMDMFPHTTHVESIALFVRSGA